MKDSLDHNCCLTKGISASFIFFLQERHAHIWEWTPDSFHQPSLTLNLNILNSERLRVLTAACNTPKHNARGSHLRTNKCAWCLDTPQCLNSISAAVRTLFLFLASYEILMSSVWWSESTQTLLLCNGPPLCLVLHLCHPLITPSCSVQ